jgi:uncharacterized membrane protein YqjE
MAATSRSIAKRDETEVRLEHSEVESLPTLLSRLGDDVMRLVDSQLTLLKVELKEEARTYVTGGTLIAIGGLIALVGFALANVALAFGVSTLFANTTLSVPAQFALGFVITGIFYLIVGGLIVLAMKSRLEKVDLVPDRFIEELRKDKQWLKNEL